MAFIESRLRNDDSTVVRAPDLIRWGAAIAGGILGLGFFALLNTLWLAIALGSGDGWVSGNLGWFVGVTAAVALLLGGWIAGLLAGVRGMLAGLVNGITAWALLFLLSITAIIPGATSLTAALSGGLQAGSGTVGGPLGAPGGGFTLGSALWTSFWSLLIGLVLAAAGGILGGRMHRPVKTAANRPRTGDRDDTGPPPATVPAARRENGTGEPVEIRDTGASTR